MTYAGKPVVADSRLGLTLRETGPLASGFRVLDVKRASRDETYTLVAGKTREARDRCEEMTVALERAGERPVRLDVVFRAFDDGAALRYVLPQQAGLDQVEVVSEDTRFRFLADHRAWVLLLSSFTTSNEREFVPMPLLGIKPESIVGPPLTIEAGDGLVVALAEANLRKWSGLHFARIEGGNDSRHPTLVTKLAPLPSEPGIVVRGVLPLVSPWRVLMLGAKPGDLIESTILTSLADPNEIGDTSWIKPGKVAWDWWNGPVVPNVPCKAGMNDETFRHFIDFAAEFGLEYVLDRRRLVRRPPGRRRPTSRSPTPELDIPGLVAYAKGKNVRILVWLHWEAVRDQIDVAFPLYEKWGLAGVKIDFMDRKDQEIVSFYQRAAARRRRAPPDGRLPRRLRGLGRGAHLPEPADPRGRHGPRVPQVERPDDAPPQRDASPSPACWRAHGLHAGRLPQRHGRGVRPAQPAASRDGHARAPARDVRRLRQPAADARGHAGGLPRRAGSGVPQGRPGELGRDPGAGRERSASTSSSRGGAEPTGSSGP